MTPEWKKKYGPMVFKAVQWIAAIIVGAVASYLGITPEKEVPGPERLIVVEPIEEFEINTSGWVNDRDAIDAACKTLDVQVFGATPAGAATDLPKAVYLWKFHEKLLGAPPPLKDQNPTGSCVGFGTTTAVERTLAAEISLRGGDRSEFSFFSEEVTYAGSRYEANGNRPPGFRGDGSNGSWAATFVTKWGMVPKAKYEHHDLTEYSASRARSWNNTGVPDYLEPVARKYPVKSAARMRSAQDIKAALASGYGVQMASSLAVSRQRDANGVARESGEWAHSMCVDGYHTDDAGRLYFHVENSWSKVRYHVGPVGWGNPTEAGFWIEAGAIDRACRQGDTYAFSGATGFPARKIPDNWFLAAPVRRDPIALLPEWRLTP